MIIETKLFHNGEIYRDRIMLSEVELKFVKDREEIIKTARRICAARCVQRWLRDINQNNQKTQANE